MRKLKRIKPYTPHWEALANRVAREFAPPVYPCMKCGHPYLSGYCCNTCGDANPSEKAPKCKPSK